MASSEPLLRDGDCLETWATVKPLNPRGCLDAAWASQFPLSTRGRSIVDNHGERFRLRGVNWYGASDIAQVVGGLNVQSLDVICQSIHNLGFNVVRLPFSNEMLRTGVPVEGSIDYKRNPRLRGLNALEVYDEVVRSLGRHQVAVIVNNHTTYGEFCGPPSRNSLWFDPYGSFSEEQWMQDWTMVARRYLRMPHVVGFDLRNEIRPRKSHWPFWGCGSRSKPPRGKCNWARAACTAAERLLVVSPHALIVVERIVWPQRGLRQMAANPGPLLPALEGRLVLGAHLYHWSGPGRFVPRWSEPPGLRWLFRLLRIMGIVSKTNYGDLGREQLKEQVWSEFGGILEAGSCPVWISEFGADLGNPDEMRWLQDFVSILADADADWAYWPLNVGPKPGCGSDESYGMLGLDWRPKESGDYRLRLLGALGLAPPPDAPPEAAVRPESPKAAMGRVRSEEDCRAVLGAKDPLLAMKSAPDVRGALLSWAPSSRVQAFSGMRRVQTASATMSEIIGGAVGNQYGQLKRATSAGPVVQKISEEDFGP